MQAFEVGEYTTLVFTTVVDRFSRFDEEDEGDDGQGGSRELWEGKGLKPGLSIVDELWAYAQDKDPDLALKYNVAFIQVNKHGHIVIAFFPQKVQTKLHIRTGKTAESEDLKAKMEQSGLSVEYKEQGKSSRYRIAVDNDKFNDHVTEINAMVELAIRGLE